MDVLELPGIKDLSMTRKKKLMRDLQTAKKGEVVDYDEIPKEFIVIRAQLVEAYRMTDIVEENDDSRFATIEINEQGDVLGGIVHAGFGVLLSKINEFFGAGNEE